MLLGWPTHCHLATFQQVWESSKFNLKFVTQLLRLKKGCEEVPVVSQRALSSGRGQCSTEMLPATWPTRCKQLMLAKAAVKFWLPGNNYDRPQREKGNLFFLIKDLVAVHCWCGCMLYVCIFWWCVFSKALPGMEQFLFWGEVRRSSQSVPPPPPPPLTFSPSRLWALVCCFSDAALTSDSSLFITSVGASLGLLSLPIHRLARRSVKSL